MSGLLCRLACLAALLSVGGSQEETCLSPQHEQALLERIRVLEGQLAAAAGPSAPAAAAAGSGQPLALPAELPFALVSDLDKKSRDPKRFSWHSLLRRGVLHVGAEEGARRFRIEWGETHRLESPLSVKNRSMELSELVAFNGQLLAVCDITGLVFGLENFPAKPRAVQQFALADGDGQSSTKPFKAEWATVKDGKLLVGSMGREWVGDDGSIESYNNQWVKAIDSSGRVESLNWRPAYEALRAATNTSLPGYLWHEAVHWDPGARRWLVLPRKASEREPYDPDADELRGTNLMLLASEDFSDIEVRRLGPVEADFGFTAVRKVPGLDGVYMALKVREVGDETETRICLFDLSGNLLLDPPFQPVDAAKFEGLEFLDS